MNNRTFNPRLDLCRCDVCDATMIGFQTWLPTVGVRSQIEYVVQFACGAKWNATRKHCFRATESTMPDGRYTPWKDSYPTSFLEEDTCPNAARMLRVLRESKGITPA
jgi:hypothetical protein